MVNFTRKSSDLFTQRFPNEPLRKISFFELFSIFYRREGDDILLLRAYMKFFTPVVPFDFNGHIFLPPTKKQYCLWIPLFLFMAFQSVRYVIMIRELTHNSHLEDTFVMVFWCWSYFSTTVHLYNGVFNSNHFLKACNSWILYKGANTTQFSSLLWKLIRLGTTSTLVNMSFFIWKPNATHFLYSSTGFDSNSPYFWTYLPLFLIYESLSSYIVFGSHMVHDSLLMGWVSSISVNISNLRSISESEGMNITEKEMHQYRTLQVFEKIINRAFGGVFLFIKFSSYFKISYIAVMVISGLATVNAINVLYGIPLGLPLILRIHGYLPGMAIMRRQSIKLLQKWKNEKVWNLRKNRTLIKSCHILEYNAGGAYEVKEKTIMKFTEGVAGQTVAVLITVKEANLF